MTQLLISAQNLAEAEILLELGIDLIDLKRPQEGALGALALSEIADIVRSIRGRRWVSATIGDLPMEPTSITKAIQATADCGVDIVKVGIFPSPNVASCVQAIGALTAQVRVIAVLFADQAWDMDILPLLQQHHFYGVMLDTALKDGSSLMNHVSMPELQNFVSEAKSRELFCGVAGSLSLHHIDRLHFLHADYLGFRTAACENALRNAAINRYNVQQLSIMLHKNNMRLPNTLPQAVEWDSALQLK